MGIKILVTYHYPDGINGISNISSKHLALFFSKGVSIKDWYLSGILEREIQLYIELLNQGWSVSFVTYGDKSDLNFKKNLKGIQIHCNYYGLSPKWYELLIFFIHRKVLKKCHLIKTNQMHGAEIALTAAEKFKKPLVNRMGYLLTDAVERLPEFQNFDLDKINKMQNDVFNKANKIIVTTQLIFNRIKSNYNSLGNKLSIIPNFVDIKLFSPTNTDQKYDIIFVGRISEQKNLGSLLKALKGSKFKILVIGNGILKNNLLDEYGSNTNIKWLDAIPNYQIPMYFNQSKLFILPSFYEGHPKILIEAMSCGMVVLASNVEGNKEIIQDGINGFLCEPSAKNIEKRINEIFIYAEDQLKSIKIAAREYVVERFSLEKIIDLELKLYESVLNESTT